MQAATFFWEREATEKSIALKQAAAANYLPI